MSERARWERDVREQMAAEEADGEAVEDALEVFDEGASPFASERSEEGAHGTERGQRKPPFGSGGEGAVPGKRRRGAADYFDGSSPAHSSSIFS